MFERLCESFLRFTPDLVVGKNRVFLEMSRTRKLFGEESLSARARVLGTRLGLDSSTWRFGSGATIPRAWLRTKWRTENSGELPVDAYFDVLDPLWFQEPDRSRRERLAMFRALGMRSLRCLFEIPKEAWLVRFGEEFDLFSEQYENGGSIPWNRFVPSSVFSETARWNADDQVLEAEGLIFRLKPLVDRLMERLHAHHRAIRTIRISLKLDRASPDREISLSFSFPQTSRVLLLKILREKIAREMERDPLSDPVVGAGIEVTETAPRETTAARFAFSEKDEQEEAKKERMLELVAYLGLKIGDAGGSVFCARTSGHLLPERSWERVLPTDSQTVQAGQIPLQTARISALFPRRPVRIFPEPVRLFRIGSDLRLGGEFWRIQSISEPERLSGYEWDVDDTGGFDRTYYRVKVRGPDGVFEEWWIYRDGNAGELCLHGVY